MHSLVDITERLVGGITSPNEKKNIREHRWITNRTENRGCERATTSWTFSHSLSLFFFLFIIVFANSLVALGFVALFFFFARFAAGGVFFFFFSLHLLLVDISFFFFNAKMGISLFEVVLGFAILFFDYLYYMSDPLFLLIFLEWTGSESYSWIILNIFSILQSVR